MPDPFSFQHIPAPGLKDKILCLSLTPCLQRTLTFPKLTIGEVNRTRKIEITASGKAVNVARVLSELGSTAFQVGFLGGANGVAVAEMLRAGCFPFHYIVVQSETRICQTLIDQENGEVTELVEEMVNPSETEWASLMDWLQKEAQQFEDYALTGSPPPGSGSDIYARIMGAIRSHNPSSRFWVDSQKSPMLAALKAEPFLVKLNQIEYATTVGQSFDSPESAVRHAKGWLDQTEWVVMTSGSDRVWMLGRETSFVGIPPKINALNPIGSGDAMTAGLMSGFHQGLGWPEILRLGIACGTANALSPTSGTLPMETLENLRSQTTIHEWTHPFGNN
jgi:tagatose 6-phosphate kinase